MGVHTVHKDRNVHCTYRVGCTLYIPYIKIGCTLYIPYAKTGAQRTYTEQLYVSYKKTLYIPYIKTGVYICTYRT